MFKKKLLRAFFVIFLLSSVAQSSALSFAEVINYFDFGYRVGVSPLLWSEIPAMARGQYVQYEPQSKQSSAYILGAAGLCTGVAILGLAVYGLKKLLEPKKVSKIDVAAITVNI